MSGLSCCMGDIGVHAFNLIEYTTGLEIDKVLADLDTLYPENELDVDGTTLLRMNNGSRGVITASQIATGEENNLSIAVYGDQGGLKWEQEHPMYLKHLIEGAPTQIYKPEINTTVSLPWRAQKLLLAIRRGYLMQWEIFIMVWRLPLGVDLTDWEPFPLSMMV